jgi:hypothetical protein
MEPEGSLLHSQVLATCPYPELDKNITLMKTLILSQRSIAALSFQNCT